VYAIGCVCDVLLVEHAKDERLSADLQEIKTTVGRAASLTRQLMAFSRAQPLTAMPLEVDLLLKDLGKMLPRMVGEDVRVDVSPRAKSATVVADPSQVEQIVMNLVVNARDAMPQGGHMLIESESVVVDSPTDARHPGVAPGRYVVLTVTDTGMGMPPEVMDRVFDPFFTTKAPGKGTGLGLATVYGIVLQHRGFVTVESEPGRGACFRVYLPEITPALVRPSEISLPDVKAGKGETVLLVEDEDGPRRVASRILERSGYRVLTAENGRRALAVSRAHDGPIHVVVADVVMPEMGGAEMWEVLAQERPESCVLFVSGYSDEAVVFPERPGPRAAFLPKPFAMAELLEAIAASLQRSAVPPAP